MKRQLLMSMLLATSIFAHEFIVKPQQSDATVGKAIPFGVMVAHRFCISEELEKSEYVNISLWEDGKKSKEADLAENNAFLTLDGTVTPTKKGGAIIAGHREAMAWSKTTKGWAVGDKKTLKGVLETNLYEKFAKVLLVVDGDDSGFDDIIGDRLEIIPLTSPAAARPGDEIQFKVLFDGKPLTTTILAGFDGFSKGQNTYAFSGDTDENGIVTIPFYSGGLWFVRANHTIDAEDQELYNEHNIRANYMFELR